MIATSASKQTNGRVHPLDIILIALNNVNVVLHVIGLYLLWCIRPKKVQHWFLIILSVSELLKNILIQVITIPELVGVADEKWDAEVYVYLAFVYDYGVTALYYLTMYFITFDRLLRISLSNKYSIYCNVRRTKILILVASVFCVLLSAVLAVVYYVTGPESGMRYFVFTADTEAAFVVYVHPCIDILFVMLAIVVYYKIFSMYSRSQRRVSRSSLRRKKETENTLKTVIQSTYFVPVLLILSFLLFAVIPDLIVSYYLISGTTISYPLEMVCSLMFTVSDLCDAFIYIFIQRPVRNLFLRKFGLRRFLGNGSDIESTDISRYAMSRRQSSQC